MLFFRRSLYWPYFLTLVFGQLNPEEAKNTTKNETQPDQSKLSCEKRLVDLRERCEAKIALVQSTFEEVKSTYQDLNTQNEIFLGKLSKLFQNSTIFDNVFFKEIDASSNWFDFTLAYKLIEKVMKIAQEAEESKEKVLEQLKSNKSKQKSKKTKSSTKNSKKKKKSKSKKEGKKKSSNSLSSYKDKQIKIPIENLKKTDTENDQTPAEIKPENLIQIDSKEFDKLIADQISCMRTQNFLTDQIKRLEESLKCPASEPCKEVALPHSPSRRV